MAKIKKENIILKASMPSKSVKEKANITTIPSATTERKGVIRIATDNEVIQGTDNTTAITPHTLKLATHFEYEQGIASDTWVIQHNLNKHPSVTLVDSAGTQFLAQVEYNDENTCTIYLNGETKGKAYLN